MQVSQKLYFLAAFVGFIGISSCARTSTSTQSQIVGGSGAFASAIASPLENRSVPTQQPKTNKYVGATTPLETKKFIPIGIRLNGCTSKTLSTMKTIDSSQRVQTIVTETISSDDRDTVAYIQRLQVLMGQLRKLSVPLIQIGCSY